MLKPKIPSKVSIRLAIFFELLQKAKEAKFSNPYYQKVWRYAFAGIVVFLAIFADLNLEVLGQTPTMLLFSGVILVTWYGGLGPALLASILCMLSLDYYFIRPIHSITFGPAYFARSAIFIVVILFISSLIESHRQGEIKANRLVQRQKIFINDASHELFTPLAIIKAQDELVLQDPRSSLSDYQKTILNNITDIDRISNMVKDLLEMLKLENSKKAPTLISLTQITTTVVNRMKLLAEKKGLQLSIEAGSEAHVIGDAGALEHMITNLVQNSIKYTPKGSITLTIKDSDVIVLEIQDTGIGISDQDLPNIFEPFYKADAARTWHKSGAGLGLSIVKRTVESHNANINVQSELNHGTKIQIQFAKVL
ncbi:MAG: hypothetical protein NVSMB66_0010 [Candidatus Doudnabacteria bacterium]